jgi:hypothetical protein
MGPYRQFSGEQRAKVGAYLLAEFRAGRLVRPKSCIGCGADRGLIDAHNEDYDRPDEYVGLCIRCHLMLHCRFRNRDAWDRYRAMLRDGAVFPPLYSRSFGPIAHLLNVLGERQVEMGAAVVMRSGPPLGKPRGEGYLDTIRD